MTSEQNQRLADQLRAYRSRNEWGDPVEHEICNQAADRLEDWEAYAIQFTMLIGLKDQRIDRLERELAELKSPPVIFIPPVAPEVAEWFKPEQWNVPREPIVILPPVDATINVAARELLDILEQGDTLEVFQVAKARLARLVGYKPPPPAADVGSPASA